MIRAAGPTSYDGECAAQRGDAESGPSGRESGVFRNPKVTSDRVIALLGRGLADTQAELLSFGEDIAGNGPWRWRKALPFIAGSRVGEGGVGSRSASA